jgi:hypothetical protein
LNPECQHLPPFVLGQEKDIRKRKSGECSELEVWTSGARKMRGEDNGKISIDLREDGEAAL